MGGKDIFIGTYETQHPHGLDPVTDLDRYRHVLIATGAGPSDVDSVVEQKLREISAKFPHWWNAHKASKHQEGLFHVLSGEDKQFWKFPSESVVVVTPSLNSGPQELYTQKLEFFKAESGEQGRDEKMNNAKGAFGRSLIQISSRGELNPFGVVAEHYTTIQAFVSRLLGIG